MNSSQIKRFLWIALLSWLASGSAGFAETSPKLAQPDSDSFEMRQPVSHLVQELNLTSEQVASITSLTQKLYDPAIALSRDFNQAQQELDRLLAGSDATVGQIRAESRRVEALRQLIYRLSVEYRIGVREVLTPEQRAKLMQLCCTQKSEIRKTP